MLELKKRVFFEDLRVPAKEKKLTINDFNVVEFAADLGGQKRPGK